MTISNVNSGVGTSGLAENGAVTSTSAGAFQLPVRAGNHAETVGPAGPLLLARGYSLAGDNAQILEDVVGAALRKSDLTPAQRTELESMLERLTQTTSWAETGHFSNAKAQKYALAKLVAALVMYKQGHYGVADVYEENPGHRVVFGNTLNAILSGAFVVRALDNDQFNEFYRTQRRPTGESAAAPHAGAFQTTDHTLNRTVIVMRLDAAANVFGNYRSTITLLHEANHAVYASERGRIPYDDWARVMEEFRAYAVGDFFLGTTRTSHDFIRAIAKRPDEFTIQSSAERTRATYPSLVGAYARDSHFRAAVDRFIDLIDANPDQGTPEQLAEVLRSELESTWPIDPRRLSLPFLRLPQRTDNRAP